MDLSFRYLTVNQKNRLGVNASQLRQAFVIDLYLRVAFNPCLFLTGSYHNRNFLCENMTPHPWNGYSKDFFHHIPQALLGPLAPEHPDTPSAVKPTSLFKEKIEWWVRQFLHIPVLSPHLNSSFHERHSFSLQQPTSSPVFHIPSPLPKSIFLNFCAISNIFSLVFVFNLQIRFSLSSVWKGKREKNEEAGWDKKKKGTWSNWT